MISISKVQRTICTSIESDTWSLRFTPVSRFVTNQDNKSALEVKVRLDIKGDTHAYLTLEELGNIVEALIEVQNDEH